MSITARVQTMDRDVELLIDETLTPQAFSKQFGQAAREIIRKQDDINDARLGRDVHYETFVDGAVGRPLEEAKRIVVAEWDLLEGAFQSIHAMLIDQAPVLTGAYARSITLFADDTPIPTGEMPDYPVREFYFAATVPYARKIERGLSSQAPEGVFEAVAAVAKKRFSNMARIRFGFRSIMGGQGVQYVPLVRPSRRRGRAGSGRAQRSAAAFERANRQPALVIVPR